MTEEISGLRAESENSFNASNQVIIDGVDVAGCVYYTPTCVSTHLWGNLTKSTKCENNPNCYYKQIKRLEQENKELKEENNPLRVDAARAKIKAKKYRSALEEIRDYADALYNEPLIEGSKIRLRSGMYRIQTKINEVLNDIQ